MAESKEELKSFLMKVKDESEKVGLNSAFRKLRSWYPVPSLPGKIDGEIMEAVRDFIFLSSKIIADGVCSHEIKRCLLFERKAMTSPESIVKIRDISLPAKVCIVKAVVFPVVMYR